MKKIAIMQPYFFPYIGYFQLINSVDVFLVYDNIKYTKKGWINRNRMLLNGEAEVFSLSIKNDSDTLNVIERELAVDFDRRKIINKFKGAYQKAPFFSETMPLVEDIFLYGNSNLFDFILNSILRICQYLKIKTEIKISSKVDIDHDLKGQEKVIALCQELSANAYVNAIGGMDLYSKIDFQEKDIDLKFVKTKYFEYQQFNDEFVPWLSIIDVMMFNPFEMVVDLINNKYELI